MNLIIMQNSAQEREYANDWKEFEGTFNGVLTLMHPQKTLRVLAQPETKPVNPEHSLKD